ncbi:MAG: GAF domain-containing protein [Thermodesulfobacteriota bacterium]|nr:GAF domain-containing protein [Thermodesulfobacteriota bacterium]
MKTEHSNRLFGVFETSELFSLKDLLDKMIEYGRLKLACDGGSVFFFDGATARLELYAHSYGNTSPFSLAPGQGVAGRSFVDRVPVFASGLELTRLYVPLDFLLREKIRAVVALPISAFKTPMAVFCFYFTRAGAQSPVETDVHGLTQEENRAVEVFYEELSAPEIGMSLHKKRVLQVQNDLHAAGGAPSMLRTELSRFISALKKVYHGSDQPFPDLLYVQLVDHPQRTIRTLRGFGMPLSFEFLPAHSLESKDIEADIVRTCQAEIIVGNDEKRFEQRVYKQYMHKQYVRLWFPLFPFPCPSDLGGFGTIEEALHGLLVWDNVEKQDDIMTRWLVRWPKEKTPPSGLVFGTVQIGYKRRNMNNLSLKPWTKDLAVWHMARVYELSKDLFSATFSGALERIGRLLASVTQGELSRVVCSFLHGKVQEARTYPVSPPWSVAVPETEKGRSSIPAPSKDPLSFDSDPVTLEYLDPVVRTGFPSDYMKRLLNTNKIIAAKSIQVASHLYNAAIYPQELLVPDDDPSYFGTLIKDSVVLSVCEEAAEMTGAMCCKAYFFSKKAFPGEKNAQDRPWLIRPPTTWNEKPCDQRFSKDIEDAARKVVLKKKSEYLKPSQKPCLKHAVTLLPIELSDALMGVIVLVFPENKEFFASEKRDMERRVPRWVYRIYMHQLILRDRFSARMTELRDDITKAGKLAKRDTSDLNRVTEFINEVLRRTVRRQTSGIGWITLFSKSATGPDRWERFWHLQKTASTNPDVGYHIFVHTPLSGPCRDACDKPGPVIYSGLKKKEQMQDTLAKIDNEISNLKNEDQVDEAEQLRFFSNAVQAGEEESSTILTFPILKRGDETSDFKGAYSLILPGDHYYDAVHRRLLTELGELLAETLDQVRQLDQSRSEQKYRRCVDDLRRDFVNASNVDDLVGALLHKLGPVTTEKSKEGPDEIETLRLADDIVLWKLSLDHTELVVRSARGNGLAAFQCSPSFQAVDPREHPLFAEENIKWPAKHKPLSLKQGSFRIWTFSLGETTATKKINKICNAYARSTGRKWLVTFPLLDAAGRIFGVIDCLRDKPLYAGEEVFERLLHSISLQFCSAFTNCHFEMVSRITKELFESTEQMFLYFRTQDVYQELVRRLKKVFGCEHCDLFLDDQHGKMLLYSTTRQHGPTSDKDKFRFLVIKDTTDTEILGACLNTGRPQIRHAGTSQSPSDNLSSALKNLLPNDVRFERMAVPLKSAIQGRDTVVGMLHLQGPLPRYRNSSNQKGKKPLKKNLMFTAEDLQLCIDLTLPTETIVRRVRLVEQQQWLVNELVHSLGQPLQVLRSVANQPIRALAQSDREGEVRCQGNAG